MHENAVNQQFAFLCHIKLQEKMGVRMRERERERERENYNTTVKLMSLILSAFTTILS